MTSRYSEADIMNAIYSSAPGERELEILISKEAESYLEVMAKRSAEITLRRFGRIINLYAPLYISNECINECKYCGFNVHNKIPRKTLSMDEIIREVKAMKQMGFEHILLLTGEAPRKVPLSYLKEVISETKKTVANVSIEIYPFDDKGYLELVKSGCDGITIYQETYNRNLYKELHGKGPKSDFNFRYEAPINAAKAGMRSVGLGFLIGIAPWKEEIIELYRHALKVSKASWKSRLAFSFPRMRPHEGNYQPSHFVKNSELAQMIFALRIMFPDAELVLSTRESPKLRDGFIGLGITRMSAGSSTVPGGYAEKTSEPGQFEIDDTRSPAEVFEIIKNKGFDPVWKDWDAAFCHPL